jgi:hypothetical protein
MNSWQIPYNTREGHGIQLTVKFGAKVAAFAGPRWSGGLAQPGQEGINAFE